MKRFLCKSGITTALMVTMVSGGHAQVSAIDSQSMQLTLGESQVLQLPQAVKRVAVGHPGIADFILLGPKELYVLGKSPGMTNLVMWDASGKASSLRTQVAMNLTPLRELLQRILPGEKDIEVLSSGDAVILKGEVSDAVAAETAQRLASTQLENDSASAASDGKDSKEGKDNKDSKPTKTGMRVINLLKVRSPQQVMLEVRVA